MTHHQHIQVLFHGIDGVGHRGVGGGGEDVRAGDDLDDVGGVAAAGADGLSAGASAVSTASVGVASKPAPDCEPGISPGASLLSFNSATEAGRPGWFASGKTMAMPTMTIVPPIKTGVNRFIFCLKARGRNLPPPDLRVEQGYFLMAMLIIPFTAELPCVTDVLP